MIWIDKYGWPLEMVNGRPITNFIRILLHARKRMSKAEFTRRTGVPVA